MKSAPAKPDWYCLQLHALEHLPRVLAGMGFARSIGPMPWGGTPLYDRRALQRVRTLRHGYRSPWADTDRSHVGKSNRARMREPVRLMISPQRAIYVSEIRGDWSDETGGARGDSLMELGALMWGCRFGQAGYRIAKLAGLDGVPNA